MGVRTYWKRNVAKNMQVEYRAEQKVPIPKVFVRALQFTASSARLFLGMWLVSQQGVDLCDGLRGHLG